MFYERTWKTEKKKNPTQTNLTNQTENSNILFIHIHKFQHNSKTAWVNISISVNTEGRKNNFCWVWNFTYFTSQILILYNSFLGAIPVVEWLIRVINPNGAKRSSHSQSMRNRAIKENSIRRKVGQIRGREVILWLLNTAWHFVQCGGSARRAINSWQDERIVQN